MRIATSLPQDDLRKVKAAARSLEGDGYAVLGTVENKHDPFLPLAIAAVETERVELATGIAISFSRSPMAVANASWDLNEASRGRFVLGLGTQIKPHNERRFSVPWTPPAPRMREYVQALRAIWRCWRFGEKLAFEGEHYRFSLMPPYFVPESLNLRLPPVTLAAVGPAMLRVTGEVADGVRLHPFCTAQIPRDRRHARIADRHGPHRAHSARTSRSPAAASSPPAPRTRPFTSSANGCAAASASTARRLPIIPCSKRTACTTSGLSSIA